MPDVIACYGRFSDWISLFSILKKSPKKNQTNPHLLPILKNTFHMYKRLKLMNERGKSSLLSKGDAMMKWIMHCTNFSIFPMNLGQKGFKGEYDDPYDCWWRFNELFSVTFMENWFSYFFSIFYLHFVDCRGILLTVSLHSLGIHQFIFKLGKIQK